MTARGPAATEAPAARAGLLAALSGNMLLDAIEVAALMVALPVIGADLDLRPSATQWLVSAFALGFAATLWLGPRLAARYGRRRVYLPAVAVFAVASLLSAATGDLLLLAGLRFVKGCCAAFTASSGVALILTSFPEGARRDRALSVYTLFGAGGFSLGLLLSGVLSGVDWRWTLNAPAPAAVILLLVAARTVPADAPSRMAVPAARELLRWPGLARFAVVAGTLNGSYWAMLLVLTHHLRLSPWQTGIALLPAAVPLALASPYTGGLVRRAGATRLVAAGTVLPPLGYLTLLRLGPHTSYPAVVLPALLLVGAGFVLAFTALHVRAMAAVPAAGRAGATALYQTGVQLIGAIAVIAAGTLLTAAAGPAPAVLFTAAAGAAGTVLAWTARS